MVDIIHLWYFHLPNYILALLMYLLMGRLLLSFFVEEEWDNYIWRSFCRLTNPVTKIVSYVTPDVVPYRLLMIFTILWIALARFFTYLLLLPSVLH